MSRLREDAPPDLGWLAERLEGKDPRRLTHPVLGAIVLLLRDARGEVVRATVEITRDRACLHRGALPPTGLELLIRGPLAGFSDYFHSDPLVAAETLDFYGEPQLMGTLAELLLQTRPPWTLQANRR